MACQLGGVASRRTVERHASLRPSWLLFSSGPATVPSATVTADRRGLDLGQILYAPDSTALFATSWSDGKDGQRRTVVLRLDPSNLATAAQREFIGFRWLLLLAR